MPGCRKPLETILQDVEDRLVLDEYSIAAAFSEFSHHLAPFPFLETS